jgi:DNA-binding response OmpR family regulator
VLRRSAERPIDVRTLAEGGRTIDLERREVLLAGGERRGLSEREVDILRYLAGSNGRAVTREELLTRVWGLDTRGLATRTIDMHIARLREKLGEDPDAARIVVTVRSKGYMLGDSVEIAAP